MALEGLTEIILKAWRYKGSRVGSQPEPTPLECTPDGALKVHIANDPVMSNAIPSSGQIPIGNGSGQYVPQTMSGDATLAANGAITIATGVVTDAKLANMGARSVKGRSANSAGVPADISFASSAGKALIDRGSVLGAFYAYQRATRSGGGTVTVAAVDENMAIIEVDATTSTTTLPLPAVATAGAGYVIIVMKTDSSANTVIIDPNSSETINGATTNTLNAQYSYVRLYCTGSAWLVIDTNDWMQVRQTSLANVPGTGAWGDAGTITLPPGEWIVDVGANFNANGANVTDASMGIGTASGTGTTGLQAGDTLISIKLPTAATGGGGFVSGWRTRITTGTPYYIKINLTFITATPQYTSRISAHRIG